MDIELVNLGCMRLKESTPEEREKATETVLKNLEEYSGYYSALLQYETEFRNRKAPPFKSWLTEFTEEYKMKVLRMHSHHSTASLPEVTACISCERGNGSWQKMTTLMYSGDPFCMKQSILSYVEPEFFREGAGTWGGKPTF